ncbi:acyl CoA binding protein-domain-containing protein [Absidia repens]|uniref:Acyl CoA binding protein-domain-containing protein n=1 Tax=Absidia repens TaxID=90262 RepID=A0A1X2IKN7_9FUNG|nr:acyl CoA binding protein-domain-containing protein [Absidia repens]
MTSQQRLSTNSSSSFQTQIQFSRALTVVRSLPSGNTHWQPSGQDKLLFYGLYKQALEGDCHISRPSSRLVVAYSKWKAWDQLRQWTPVEAQKHYVTLLLDMLSSFVERYPQHELTRSLRESIHYIQLDTDMDPSITSSLIDEKDSSSYASSHHHHHHHQPPAVHLSNTSPVTPDDNTLSFPSKQQQQQQHSWHESNRLLLQPLAADYYDGMSDLDTIDREVAAATSGLGLMAPEQHPYHHYHHHHQHQQQEQQNQSELVESVSERALESLQTDVAALTEQLGHLRTSLAQRRHDKLRWTWLWLGKTVVKHASINLVILFLVFLVLLKRKSPIAYAIIGYVGSRIQNILHYLAQKMYFWKVTV